MKCVVFEIVLLEGPLLVALVESPIDEIKSFGVSQSKRSLYSLGRRSYLLNYSFSENPGLLFIGQ